MKSISFFFALIFVLITPFLWNTTIHHFFVSSFIIFIIDVLSFPDIVDYFASYTTTQFSCIFAISFACLTASSLVLSLLSFLLLLSFYSSTLSSQHVTFLRRVMLLLLLVVVLLLSFQPDFTPLYESGLNSFSERLYSPSILFTVARFTLSSTSPSPFCSLQRDSCESSNPPFLPPFSPLLALAKELRCSFRRASSPR